MDARGGHAPEAWTHEEDKRILQGVAMVGFRWKKIAEAIPGRSGDAVRNRYQRLKAATADGLAGDHLASSEAHTGASAPPLSGCSSALMPPPPRPAQAYVVPASFPAAADACRSACEQRGMNASCSGKGGMANVPSYAPVASAYVSTDTESCMPPLVAVASALPASSANGFTHAAASSWTNLPLGFVQGRTGVQQAGMQQAAPQQAALQQAVMQQAALEQACRSAPLPARAVQARCGRSATAPAACFASAQATDPFAQMLATAVPSVLQPGVRFQPTGSIVSSLPSGFDCDSSYSSLESNSRSRSRSNAFEASR